MRTRTEKIAFSRNLRKNQTDVEKILWSKLRGKRFGGIKFRRQQLIGHYIVDFVSFERKLIIDLDGGQHNSDEEKYKDAQRTKWFHSQGFEVLRFWNSEIAGDLDGVLHVIHDFLRNFSLPLTLPSPTGGEG